jgi:hypothetical protein
MHFKIQPGAFYTAQFNGKKKIIRYLSRSAVCHTAGVLAAKFYWRNARKAKGLPHDKPKLIMPSSVQIVWHKACRCVTTSAGSLVVIR